MTDVCCQVIGFVRYPLTRCIFRVICRHVIILCPKCSWLHKSWAGDSHSPTPVSFLEGSYQATWIFVLRFSLYVFNSNFLFIYQVWTLAGKDCLVYRVANKHICRVNHKKRPACWQTETYRKSLQRLTHIRSSFAVAQMQTQCVRACPRECWLPTEWVSMIGSRKLHLYTQEYHLCHFNIEPL